MFIKKVQLIKILALAFALMGASQGAQAQAANYTGNTYTVTFQYPNPLDTFERCDAYSGAGRYAAENAEEEALEECRNDHNGDCISEGAVFRSILSVQFIGYKACAATVSVHGYR